MYITAAVGVLGLLIFIIQLIEDPESANPVIFGLCSYVYFGAASSNVMLKKGRSGALGWLLGLFFSILGLLICTLISKKAETTEFGKDSNQPPISAPTQDKAVPSMPVAPAIVTTNMPKGEPVTVQNIASYEAKLKTEFGLTHTSAGWFFEGRGVTDRQSLWKKPEECVPALKALKDLMDFSQVCVVVAGQNLLVCNTKPKPYGIAVGMNSSEIAAFIALVIKDNGKQVVQYQGTWLLTF